MQPLPASPPPPPSGLPKRIFFPLLCNNYLSVDGRPTQVVKYYLVSSQRIASRAGSTGAVIYYHDHLGSTVGSSGGESTRYYPFGATRNGNLFALPTDHTFTGLSTERSRPLAHLRLRPAQYADLSRKIPSAVRRMILRSSQSDQFSIYHRSYLVRSAIEVSPRRPRGDRGDDPGHAAGS